MPRRALRVLWLAGLALAGVVAGHAIAYTIALPDPEARSALLATTGHGYWRAAVAAGLSAGLCSAAAFLAHRARDAARSSVSASGLPPWLAPRLAAVQIGLFVAIELAERLGAGSPLHGLVSHGLLWRGVLGQVLVAAVATLILRWLAHLAEFVGRLVAGGRRPHRRLVRFPRPASDAPASGSDWAALGARAPPVLRVS